MAFLFNFQGGFDSLITPTINLGDNLGYTPPASEFISYPFFGISFTQIDGVEVDIDFKIVENGISTPLITGCMFNWAIASQVITSFNGWNPTQEQIDQLLATWNVVPIGNPATKQDVWQAFQLFLAFYVGLIVDELYFPEDLPVSFEVPATKTDIPPPLLGGRYDVSFLLNLQVDVFAEFRVFSFLRIALAQPYNYLSNDIVNFTSFYGSLIYSADFKLDPLNSAILSCFNTVQKEINLIETSLEGVQSEIEILANSLSIIINPQ